MRGSIVFTTLAALLALGACNRAASSGSTPTANAAPSEAQVPTMSVSDLAAALDQAGSVYVYDANGRERYEQGHVPGARHVPFDAVTAAVLPTDHNARLVFYCYNES